MGVYVVFKQWEKPLACKNVCIGNCRYAIIIINMYIHTSTLGAVDISFKYLIVTAIYDMVCSKLLHHVNSVHSWPAMLSDFSTPDFTFCIAHCGGYLRDFFTI